MAIKSNEGLKKAALKKVNETYGLKETLESLQDSIVYPGEKVVIVISDFRKFSFSTKELA